MLLVTIHVSAQEHISQKQIQFNGIQLVEALEEVGSTFGLDVYFVQDEIPDKIISGAFSGTIDVVLNELFAGTPLGYVQYRSYAIVIGDSEALGQSYNADFYRFLEEGLVANQNDNASAIQKLNAGSPKLLNASGVAKIAGEILDGSNDERLVGASIYVKELKRGAVTDIDGKFEIKLPLGHYEVTLRSFGYDEQVFELSVYNDAVLPQTVLQKEALGLDEVIISATAIDDNVTRLVSGVESVSPKALEELPSFLGEVDVVKSLELLPGVSTVGEGASGFNVRGGSEDQNLVVIDEAFVFNSSHALGFFSAFSPDIVKNATLYKGVIPASYDGRLSSVLDVEMKDGSYEHIKGRAGIGNVSSRLTLEIPIKRDTTSLIIGGRANYSDFYLKQVNIPAVQKSSVQFYDANVRLTHRFTESTRVSLSAYVSGDDVVFSDQFAYNYGTWFVQGGLTNALSERFTSDFSMVLSQYQSSLSQPSGVDGFKLSNKIGYYKLKEELRYNTEKWDLSGGMSYIRYQLSPADLMPRGSESTVNAKTLEDEHAREWAVFVENTVRLSDKLSVSLGLRWAHFDNLGPGSVYQYANSDLPKVNELIDTLSFSDNEAIQSYNSFEPRLSLNYALSPTTSIKLGYSRTSQFIHQISNTSTAAPVDVRQLSNQFIKPQLANNYSLGLFKNFANNAWETSVDAYYRTIDQLIEYRDFAELLANDHLETELLSGIGRTYGVEFSVNRRVGRLSGRAAYTWSRTERQVDNEIPSDAINKGEWYPSNYDKPHSLTLLSKFELNRRNSISFVFNYSSGRPNTGPVGNFNVQNTKKVPIYTSRNNVRIPDYHRLDIAYHLKPGFQRNKRFKTSWTFSIYNVYGRENAFSVYYSQSATGQIESTKLSMLGSALPSITLNVDFK